MAAQEPGQVIQMFADYFNAGDVEGLKTLYESAAVIVPEPGPATLSGDGIAGMLQGFVDSGGKMSILGTTIYQTGDIALTHNRWRLEPPEGDAMEGVTAEVVRRQADGTWRYAIDNPWGSGALT